MRFSRIIGQSEDPKTLALVKQAESLLTQAFLEMSLGVETRNFFSRVGGSPLTYQLMAPLRHNCDISALQLRELENKLGASEGSEAKGLAEQILNIRLKNPRGVLTTAATNGQEFFYNPEFICGLEKLGVRILLEHEAYHAYLGHSDRRRGRNPALWNICIDYIVNRMILLDLKTRGFPDPNSVFKANLGDFITLNELVAMLVDPFNPPKRLEHFNPIHSFRKMASPGYKHPGDNAPPFYYADSNINDDFRRPEYIYAHLISKIPKCSKCGRLGCYKKPDELKKIEKQVKESRESAKV